MKKTLLLFIVFQVLTFVSKAQNVTGSWYGIGYVDVSGSNDSFLAELILVQKGKQITGELNYYFRDSLYHNNVSGFFDAESRYVVLKNMPIVYYKTRITNAGVDCPMDAMFQLVISRTESALKGSLQSDKSHQYTCPPISFKLKKETESTTPTYVKKEKEHEDIAVIEHDTIATPKPKVTPPVAIKKLNPDEQKKQDEFNTREKNYVRTIDVTSPTIQLEFYDNGYIDGDSITVFFNNAPIITKAQLAYAAIKLSVKLDNEDEDYELSMFAENLGTVPPNTALVILYDGKIRHEVIISSDLQKSGTIRLRRKKN